MEKKNKKAILLVSILLVGVGISFAYFVGSSLFGGNGSKVSGTTAVINGATLNVEGGLAFNDLDILPGHQTISSIKVTATGNNELIPYNLIWNGTNSLNTPLNFTVYKTSKEVDVSVTCDKKTKVENGAQILKEECTITNLESLGTSIAKGTIETNATTAKVILAEEEFITASPTGEEAFYYVILEYPNLDEDQNADIGGSFSGEVTVEESNTKPDINILAVKIEGEDGTYQDSDDIPQSGYHLNKTNSVCSNGAIPGWDTSNNIFYTKSLTKKGTSCYLYFDKGAGEASSQILANVTVKTGTPDFNQTATTDEGVYKAIDESGKDSYYFRGAVTNNYVKFAGFYWRIIRINGDGSIRIIYDGETARANGSKLTVETSAFNENASNNNMYVGFRYTSGSLHGTGTASTIANALDTWYESNLRDYESNIDQNAGFCGDRTPYTDSSGTTSGGGTGTTTTYYGAHIRLKTNKSSSPSLECSESDFYTKVGANKGNKTLTNPIALITADEVVYAGGSSNIRNGDFYLYTDQACWTMSPYYGVQGVGGNRDFAYVFRLDNTGDISGVSVYNALGMRAVINLKSDSEFTFTGTGEKGSMTNPYVVA